MSPPMPVFRPDLFGAELARLRADVHLSQRALAKLAGVSNTAISGLESGDAPAPHPSMLSKLARGLATSGSNMIDERRAEAAYLALMQAAGYVPLSEASPVSASIEAELAALFGPDEADLVAEILRKWARHDEPTRRFLLSTMKPLVFGIPGSDD